MHQFPTDFYGHYLDVIVLGYIRPELDYTSRGQTLRSLSHSIYTDDVNRFTEALIDDIQTDIKVAHNSLARPAYQSLQSILAEKPTTSSS